MTDWKNDNDIVKPLDKLASLPFGHELLVEIVEGFHRLMEESPPPDSFNTLHLTTSIEYTDSDGKQLLAAVGINKFEKE